jgi:hypothetical protein
MQIVLRVWDDSLAVNKYLQPGLKTYSSMPKTSCLPSLTILHYRLLLVLVGLLQVVWPVAASISVRSSLMSYTSPYKIQYTN